MCQNLEAHLADDGEDERVAVVVAVSTYAKVDLERVGVCLVAGGEGEDGILGSERDAAEGCRCECGENDEIERGTRSARCRGKGEHPSKAGRRRVGNVPSMEEDMWL